MARISMNEINTAMISAAAAQEAPSNGSKVWNPDFPLFQTPLNRKVLVYIPKDFDQRKVELLIHDTHKGKQFGQARCITGLVDGFEQFGYTGECPYCKATEAAWELYNIKLDQKARELGITRDNDPDNLLKGTKETLLKEMAVKNADKYICFPIVLLPCDEAGNLNSNAKEGVQACYVLWREQRFNDKFSSEVLDGLASPAGTFERWSFTYDTKGQQATAMLSAKALQVKILEKPDILAQLNPYIEACEKVVEPFTQAMAIDNIKALNFYRYDDVERDAEACIKSTRALVAASQAMLGGSVAGTAPAIASAPAPQLNTAAAAIANFGQVAPAQVAQTETIGAVAGVETGQVASTAGAVGGVAAQGTPTMPVFGSVPTAPTFGG